MRYKDGKDKLLANSPHGETKDTSLMGFDDAARQIKIILGETPAMLVDGSIEERDFLNKVVKVLSRTNFTQFDHSFFNLQDVLTKIYGRDYKDRLLKRHEGQQTEDVEIELASGNDVEFMKYFISKISGLGAKDALSDVEYLWINSDEFLERSEAVVENARLRDIYKSKLEELRKAEEKVAALKRQVKTYETKLEENNSKVTGDDEPSL